MDDIREGMERRYLDKRETFSVNDVDTLLLIGGMPCTTVGGAEILRLREGELPGEGTF